MKERKDIEAVLRSSYEAGEMDTGLYKTDVGFVVMDNVDGEIIFTWFNEAVPLKGLI